MFHGNRRKADGTVTGDHCKRFGAIAVHKGMASAADVKAAMSEQVDDDLSGREHRLLGTILYEKGLLAEFQIDVVLAELKKMTA